MSAGARKLALGRRVENRLLFTQRQVGRSVTLSVREARLWVLVGLPWTVDAPLPDPPSFISGEATRGKKVWKQLQVRGWWGGSAVPCAFWAQGGQADPPGGLGA